MNAAVGADTALIAAFGFLPWILRIYYDRKSAWSDIRWIVAFGLWINRDLCKEFVFRAVALKYLYTSLASAAVIVAPGLLTLYSVLSISSPRISPSERKDLSRSDFLKPLIFPCRTTHSRLFPRKHSFSYSYLLVGVPIGWRGAVGSFLSVDEANTQACTSERQRSWFSVNAEDYLQRGCDGNGLEGKLKSFLNSQNEDLECYPFVYLVTAPRFLGYSFNPASFWYLYDELKHLKAMIVEVNNTFDERRIYFLKNDNDESSIEVPVTGKQSADERIQIDTDDANQELKETKESSVQFSKSWKKDFHVSPFNSRKGSYSLSAKDIYRKCQVANVITLGSSKGHPKIVARIFSTGVCIDPSQMSHWNVFRFVTSWWWVGFVTFPRILREAAKLFFQRKLHVWYRPEVIRTSLGRQATDDERTIEKTFRAFLRATIEQSDTNPPLSYTSPMSSITETFHPRGSSAPLSVNSIDDAIDFQVTSPLFYTQLVRYAHLIEFFTTSLLTSTPENQIFFVSDPQRFLTLFDSQASQMLAAGNLCSNLQRNYQLGSIHWHLLRWLRNHRPKTSSITSSKNIIERRAQDIRAFSLSALDLFSMRDSDDHSPSQYGRAVIKVLASDLIAFGQPVLIDTFCTATRIILLWFFVQSATNTFVLHHSALAQTEIERSSTRCLGASRTVLGLLATHTWCALAHLA